MKLLYTWLLLLPLFVKTSICNAEAVYAAHPYAGEVELMGHFAGGLQQPQVWLISYGVKPVPVMYAVLHDNSFLMKFSAGSIAPGVYRLQFARANAVQYTDIIISNTEPVIEFVLDSAAAAVRFVQSEENRQWALYCGQRSLAIQEIDSVVKLLGNAAAKDSLVLLKELAGRKKMIAQMHNRFCRQFSHTWAGKLAQNQPLRLSGNDLFWTGIQTADTLLLNSPVFTGQITEYFKWVMATTGEKDETGRIKILEAAADTVISRFSLAERSKQFAIDYMSRGFKEMGEEEVLQYIDEKYSAATLQCGCNQPDTALQQRLIGYRLTREGMPAPGIFSADKASAPVNLLNANAADTMIVVFWASWCPHCRQVMPVLDSIMAARTTIKTLAVSIDQQSSDWSIACKKLPHLQQYCDGNGWSSKPVQDYFVSGTPSFFMLDKDRRIIKRYSNFESLKQQLNIQN